MIPKKFVNNAWVLSGIAVIGLLVHGSQAGRLGLYWEEAANFLKALLNVDGDVVKFILMDPQGFLPSERPLAYLPFVAFRAGFAVSLSFAHWIMVLFQVLTAAVLATLARRVVNEAWFSFAVGVVFLTYPLSPLQGIWMSTGFYMWSAILALFAILLFMQGFKAIETGEGRRWFLFAAIAYLASIVTHEGFILLPPAFVGVYLLLMGARKGPIRNFLGATSVWRVAAYGLGMFLIPMAAYGFWRETALPSYGGQIYSPPKIASVLGRLGGRLLIAVKTTFTPMDDALTQIILEFPPAPAYVVLSGILSLAVWAIILRLRLLESRQQKSQENSWPNAAILGAALAASGIVFIALAPVYIGGVVGTGWSSRVNFLMTVGAAMAVPGLLGLLVSPYNRFTPLAGLLGVAFLVYVGSASRILGMDQLLRLSTLFAALGDYSIKHILVTIGAVVLVALLILLIILSSVLQLRKLKHRPTDRLDALYFHICSHFLAGTVASLVLLGSLFHFSVKEQYISKWDQHKSMLHQLQRLAPALKDDTFVVMVREGYDPVSPSDYQFNSYLMALYDNESIKGNMSSQLRFHPDGVESTYNGRTRISRVSYDHLLIFEFDGRNLRIPPKIEVKTAEGNRLVVLNNPDRTKGGAILRTVVWRYLN